MHDAQGLRELLALRVLSGARWPKQQDSWRDAASSAAVLERELLSELVVNLRVFLVG